MPSLQASVKLDGNNSCGQNFPRTNGIKLASFANADAVLQCCQGEQEYAPFLNSSGLMDGWKGTSWPASFSWRAMTMSPLGIDLSGESRRGSSSARVRTVCLQVQNLPAHQITRRAYMPPKGIVDNGRWRGARSNKDDSMMRFLRLRI